ncbi:MAG TPA: GNAT family N-acetyltransferase [Jatrophihabitans sp.]
MEIRTDRLLMRRWRDSDREPFAALNADPEARRYFPSTLSREVSDADIDSYEEKWERNGVGLWALERLDTGEFLGFTGLNPMPENGPGEGFYEVGWRLAQPAWHQGFATEAARAALDVAFERLDVAEIWSHTAVANRPSIAVMLRLGLRHVTTAPHPRLPDDSPLSQHVYYRITAADR